MDIFSHILRRSTTAFTHFLCWPSDICIYVAQFSDLLPLTWFSATCCSICLTRRMTISKRLFIPTPHQKDARHRCTFAQNCMRIVEMSASDDPICNDRRQPKSSMLHLDQRPTERYTNKSENRMKKDSSNQQKAQS